MLHENRVIWKELGGLRFLDNKQVLECKDVPSCSVSFKNLQEKFFGTKRFMKNQRLNGR